MVGYKIYQVLDENEKEIFRGMVSEVCQYVHDNAYFCKETVKHSIWAKGKLKNGWQIRDTSEKFNPSNTIIYKGKVLTGTLDELAKQTGISRSSVWRYIRQGLQEEKEKVVKKKISKEEKKLKELQERADLIKIQVSKPPCYKTFLGINNDTEKIKELLGEGYEYKQVTKGHKRDKVTYLEVTYANA